METTWQLKSLSIELMGYGDYKGKFVGKIKFENGENEAFVFNLDPVEINKFLELISEKVCLTASSLGEKITQSIKAIGNPDLKTIELKTGSADR